MKAAAEHHVQVLWRILILFRLQGILPDSYPLPLRSLIIWRARVYCHVGVHQPSIKDYLKSQARTPASLDFLPEKHIIMVYESQVVKHVDDVFAGLRRYRTMPRAINLVTGPSCNDNIEQTLEVAADGCSRMHVLLIAGQSE